MNELTKARSLDELDSVLDDLAIEGFHREIASSTFIARLRASLLPTIGQEGFENAIDHISQWVLEHDICEVDSNSSSAVANLGAVCPDRLWKTPERYVHAFAKMTHNEACALLSTGINTNSLYEALGSGDVRSLSPSLALILAMSAAAFHHPDEDAILELAATRMAEFGNATRLARAAIVSRQRNRTIVPVDIRPQRVAVIIAGQLRDAERAVAAIRDSIDLANCDVYVSTWATPGATPIDRARLSRRLDAEAVSWARARSDFELRAIAKADAKTRLGTPERVRDRLSVLLGPVGDLRIHIADEQAVPFRGMDNHAKMYFHNSYWFQELGREHFTDRYDAIVKIRPDIILESDTPLGPGVFTLESRRVISDQPDWILLPWGFGIGDQVLVGDSITMAAILDVQPWKSMSTRLMTEVFGDMITLRGHINLGIELWLLGGRLAAPPFRKRGLASPKLLSRGDVEMLLATASQD